MTRTFSTFVLAILQYWEPEPSCPWFFCSQASAWRNKW